MTFSVSVSDALAMLSDRTVRERYWEPDECATQCRLCKSTFTFLNRRHHCRRCLRVFCGDCTSSKNRLVLYGYQNERVRVCDKCYEEARLENEFHETHMSLLTSGGVFQKHSKDRLKPISLTLSSDRKRLEWRPMELGKQQHHFIVVGDIRSVDTDPHSGVTFKIITDARELVLDAGSGEHRARWVTALREAVLMLSPERLRQGDPAAEVVRELAAVRLLQSDEDVVPARRSRRTPSGHDVEERISGEF